MATKQQIAKKMTAPTPFQMIGSGIKSGVKAIGGAVKGVGRFVGDAFAKDNQILQNNSAKFKQNLDNQNNGLYTGK